MVIFRIFKIHHVTASGKGVMFMGKITVSLRDVTERRLREYVTKRYPEKPYGKLSLVVEEALKEYLDKREQKG